MGAYMATPSTEKQATLGHTEFFTYVASSMQGWRIQQEDAHNCVSDFDPARHASLFAVYDGHGGAEVARYCAAYLPDFLRKLPAYANSGDPVEALKQLFLEFDTSLTTPETRAILRSLAKSNEDNPADSFEEAIGSEEEAEEEEQEEDDDEDEEDVEESDSEISALQAEAEQPLESVLQRYGGKEALSPSVKDLLNRRKQTKLGECSQSGDSSQKESQSDGDSNSADRADSSKQATDQNGSHPRTTETAVMNGDGTAENSAETKCQDSENKLAGDENAEAEEEDDDSDDDTVQLDGESDDDDEETDTDSDDDDEEEDDDDDDEDVENLGFHLPGALKGQDDSEPGVDSGTTACVALLLPMNGVVKLFVANAGDSRAVLCRGAAAVELSVDHKPEDEDERSRITAAGGTVTRDGRVNGGLNLSRALGDHCYKQAPHLPLAEQMITPAPDVTQFDLIPGADDFLVIACDGVWNSMSSQEVVSFVYDRLHPQSGEPKTESPEEEATRLSKICEELFDHCLAPNTDGDGTGCDNMTCIIVRFRDLEALAKLPSRPPQIAATSSNSPVAARKRTAGLTTTEDAPAAAAPNGVSNGSSPMTTKRSRTDLDRSVAAVVPNGDAAPAD